MYINKNGINRTVFVFKRFVIKIPTLRYGYKQFLNGLLSNERERCWSKANLEFLAKVLFTFPLCLFIIMERVDTFTEQDSFVKNLITATFKDNDYREFILSDFKNEHYGYTKDKRLVKVDYGS